MFFVKSEPVCDVLYDSCIIKFCDKLCDRFIKLNNVLTFSGQLTNITHQTNIIDHSKYTIHNTLRECLQKYSVQILYTYKYLLHRVS